MNLNEIKNNNDICDVISQYTSLRKGEDGFFEAHCPFSAECLKKEQENMKMFSSTLDWKDYTPLKVNPDKQVYYCFGCHKGGDVLTFTAEMEECSLNDAAEILSA